MNLACGIILLCENGAARELFYHNGNTCSRSPVEKIYTMVSWTFLINWQMYAKCLHVINGSWENNSSPNPLIFKFDVSVLDQDYILKFHCGSQNATLPQRIIFVPALLQWSVVNVNSTMASTHFIEASNFRMADYIVAIFDTSEMYANKMTN